MVSGPVPCQYVYWLKDLFRTRAYRLVLTRYQGMPTSTDLVPDMPTSTDSKATGTREGEGPTSPR
eukprot:1146622-Rhodomonas_salina.1